MTLNEQITDYERFKNLLFIEKDLIEFIDDILPFYGALAATCIHKDVVETAAKKIDRARYRINEMRRIIYETAAYVSETERKKFEVQP